MAVYCGIYIWKRRVGRCGHFLRSCQCIDAYRTWRLCLEIYVYVLTAKLFALFAYRMLKDDAALAKSMKNNYKPRFANKEEYIELMETFYSVEEKEHE